MTIKDFLQLIKFFLSLQIALSALFGYSLYVGSHFEFLTSMRAFIGVLFLSFGASVINHIQDRKIDQLLHRTMNRVLVLGKLKVKVAILIALFFLSLGFLLLYGDGSKVSFKLATLLGALAVIAYNGPYTYLKRSSHLALIPGAISGMMPPWIGWTLAGGELFSSQIIPILFIFLIWQVPHTWLIYLKNRDDYLDWPLPSLLKSILPRGLSKVTLTWLFLYSISLLLIPLFTVVQFQISKILLLLQVIILIVTSISILGASENGRGFKKLFMILNLSLVATMAVVAIDRFSV